MTDQHPETGSFHWRRGCLTVRIAVTLHRNAFDGYDYLEIRAIEPDRHKLPITETGYRSHVQRAGEIDRLGGAVAFTRMMLDAIV